MCRGLSRHTLGQPAQSECPGSGHGLLGTRERVAMVGGTLDVEPWNGQCPVAVVLPVPRGRDRPGVDGRVERGWEPEHESHNPHANLYAGGGDLDPDRYTWRMALLSASCTIR